MAFKSTFNLDSVGQEQYRGITVEIGRSRVNGRFFAYQDELRGGPLFSVNCEDRVDLAPRYENIIDNYFKVLEERKADVKPEKVSKKRWK